MGIAVYGVIYSNAQTDLFVALVYRPSNQGCRVGMEFQFPSPQNPTDSHRKPPRIPQEFPQNPTESYTSSHVGIPRLKVFPIPISYGQLHM